MTFHHIQERSQAQTAATLQPKQSFEQRVANEAARLNADIESVRLERVRAGGEYAIARRNSLDLAEAIKAALKEGEPKSRWSKDQTLSDKLNRLPSQPRPSTKLTREEKEDFGMGAYIGGVWTEWAK